MRLRLEQAEAFREDFALRALRYVHEAGGDVPLRFQEAVDATCARCACNRAWAGKGSFVMQIYRGCAPSELRGRLTGLLSSTV